MNFAGNKTLKILFVDDDSDESYLFNEALEQSELPILLTKAHDGIQLLKSLHNTPLPDIIIMDINMPYKDGIEALTDIRANNQFKKIFIIIYSITADKQSIKKAYEMGADLYMVKPEDFEGMLSVVKKVYNINWKNFNRPSRENFVLNLQS
jgi:CheY-like chemotaxis protein